MSVISFKSRNTIKGYKKSKLAKSETADCVVCAIASAFGVTYNQAHKFAKETYGRKNRKGTTTWVYHTKNKEFSENKTEIFGKTITQIGDKSRYSDVIKPHTYYGKKQCEMTVGTFIKNYNKGTYILSVSGHTFTVKDGSVIGNWQDSKKLRVRVQRAWEIK